MYTFSRRTQFLGALAIAAFALGACKKKDDPTPAPEPQSASPVSEEAKAAAASISADDLRAQITKLSSDEFEGRAPATPGDEKTREYLAEQLKAMDMMAVNPLARVVAPRFWGGVISMPLLAALFSTMGVFGGWFIAVVVIGVDPGAFWSQMQAAVDFRYDVMNGVIKSVVFGCAVSLIAVFEGYDCQPTAEGVSRAITRTVVMSALAILALDFVLTSFMFRGQ